MSSLTQKKKKTGSRTGIKGREPKPANWAEHPARAKSLETPTFDAETLAWHRAQNKRMWDKALPVHHAQYYTHLLLCDILQELRGE